MTKPSKFKATRSLHIVLFVVAVSVISSVFFFSNLKNQESTTNSNIGIKECNNTFSTNDSALNTKLWKAFIDKYNHIDINLPSEFMLNKYPLEFLSDDEYFEAKVDSSLLKYIFFVSDKTGGFSKYSFELELKQDCNTASSCMEADIISRSKSDSQDLCKINKTVDGNIYTFLRSSSDKNPVSTSWNTYIDTSRGVMQLGFAEKGNSHYNFPNDLLKIVNSFKFTK